MTFFLLQLSFGLERVIALTSLTMGAHGVYKGEKKIKKTDGYIERTI